MNQQQSPIIGIDLGTTNSVVAALIDGRVQVIEEEGDSILPSIVGMTLDGKLVVGSSAKNQLAAFPERTIASIKRRMGQAVQVSMADQNYSPQEISAMILRRLKQRAEIALKTEVTRAVITVPAFFDESQRQATREAGRLAGLTVERIINEPTAASLVYHAGSMERRHLIVYDLGGGTFDVSIVRIEGGVVEVLSSKGDTQLGGDDFDQILTKHVADAFLTEHGLDLMSQSTTRWRLLQACERAKCELSSSVSAKISEEFIATIEGKPVNLEVEVTREEYERLISALVERTIDCVDEAIRDSGLTISQLDELILVGGSTRTPLVQQRLRQEFQRDPQWSVNPDLAVALGAATQGAMQQGHAVGPVLIDIATHTLGLEVLVSPYTGELQFSPILRRNSPLPAKHEEIYRTVSLNQSAAIVRVFQGESDQLSRNRFLGQLLLEGLNSSARADGQILVRFALTLDGTLHVTATESQSGLSKTLKIENSLSKMDEENREAAENRLEFLFEKSDEFDSEQERRGLSVETESSSSNSIPNVDSGIQRRFDPPSGLQPTSGKLIDRAKAMRSSLAEEDLVDVDRLVEQIEKAEKYQDREVLVGLESELDDLLFYLAD